MATDGQRAPRVLGDLARGVLLATLILAPLPFGSVRLFAVGSLQLAVALALALWGARVALGGSPALPESRAGLLAAALFLALAGAQLVSMDPRLLGAVSPGTAGLYESLLEAGGPALAGTRFPWTISLAPADTLDALRRLATGLAVVILVASLFRGRRRLALLAAALVLVGAFEAAYGLLETLSGRQQIFGYVKKYYTDVVTGTYINRNHFAGAMEMCLPVALGFYLSRRGAGEGARGWRQALGRLSTRRATTNLFLALALVIMLAGLALSLSRSGILFGLLGVLVVALGYTARRRAWRGILATAAVVVAALAFVVLGSLEQVGERFSRLPEQAADAGGRLTVWGDALGAVADYPAFGTGLGSFASAFPLYRSPDVKLFFDHAHNDLLQALVETGIVGVALLLVALGAVVALTLRRIHADPDPRFCLRLGFAAGALALALHGLTDFNLRIPANGLLFAACLGAAISAPRPPRSAEPSAAVLAFPETPNEGKA